MMGKGILRMKSVSLPELELVVAAPVPEDQALGFSPQSFDEYLGQGGVKDKLRVYVGAAKQRGEALDHVLLFGPPGLGKTTLAHIIAKELGSSFKATSAPVLERPGDLVAILTSLQPRDVFFIDEIHRLPQHVEEVLYTAMENFSVDMIVGQGAGAKSIKLPLHPFTLVGATTKTGMISGPLQTRFGIVERLDFYEPLELAEIVLQNAHCLDLTITPEAAKIIGARARGTPRIVKRMLRRVRDFAQFHGAITVDHHLVERALQFLGVDAQGLNKLDRILLSHILEHFSGGPVGLETLAAMTGEDKETLEDFCEPFLMRQGFLQKTPRGRQIPPQKRLFLRKAILGEMVEEQEKIL